MNETARKPRKTLPLTSRAMKGSNRKLVRSLDEIPDFETPEDQVKFWRSHYVAKNVLDQIPSLEDEHDQ